MRDYEAALLLADVASTDGDSRLQRRHGTPAREHVHYSIDGRNYEADIYRSDRDHRGNLLLVHGFTEDGRRDERLTAFAATLARSGFVVFVPEVEGLRDFSVSSREIEVLIDALRHSISDQGPAAGESTAIAAFSLAVGPTLLAASDPAVADSVSFLISVGGYYDLVDTLRYVTTGVDAGSGDARPPPPLRAGRWAVLLSQLHWLEDDDDRELVEQMARRRLDEPTAPLEDLRRQLGSQGRAVYDLVNNRDAEQVEALLDGLPPAMLEEFRQLDLANRDLSGLRADVVLIHGPDDPIIPLSHSLRLREALAGDRQVWLYQARGLGHVDVSPGLRDGVGLWRATRRVLLLGEEQTAEARQREMDHWKQP
ncbi:pimeloyl-ACP methyl ester carboxylesterase [Natronocella acetinitrilica]|uniref:Pimeloyl-ACP methyl ester carboxylesterase n=2 Tax=Natronocella acetinitrilica TaxID=414046 RepID=A0AAE3KEI4_9GAMM|nr:pimeloyl-ACP methyl ester carboxylesterase [Natronocella acetinitrilica]